MEIKIYYFIQDCGDGSYISQHSLDLEDISDKLQAEHDAGYNLGAEIETMVISLSSKASLK